MIDRIEELDRRDTRRRRKHEGALAGWMRCDECGCRITYEPKTKPSGLRFDYYRCANGRGLHEKARYVSEDTILSRFEPALDSITLSEAQAEQVADALTKAHVQAQEAKRRQMEGFRSALSELEAGEDELYRDLKRGVLDDEGYKRQLTRIRSERQRYATLLEEGQRAVDGAYLEMAQRCLELATRAKSLWNSRSAVERRELLDRLLSNPLLSESTVRFDWRKPYRTIEKMARSANLLRGVTHEPLTPPLSRLRQR